MDNPMKKLFILFLLLVPLTISALPATPYTGFAWTQPTIDTIGNPVSVTENTVYCGLSPGNYTIVYVIPTLSTSVPFTDVLPDGTYYCAFTATAPIDTVLTESGYSNELGPFTLIAGVLPRVAPAAQGSFGFY